METIIKKVTLPGVTVVGKVALPTKKISAKSRKKYFKPFSGGATLAERLKAVGVTLK